jgi:hypothetical protein
MRFSVNCAADLYGNKVNLELNFNTCPSVSDLYRVVETTFAVESSALRPSGQTFNTFKVARFHVFDENTQAWSELFNANQLTDYCQLYAFQREGVESQQQIPPARAPTAARLANNNGAATLSSPTPRIPPTNLAGSPASVGFGQQRSMSPPHPSPRSPVREYTTPRTPFAAGTVAVAPSVGSATASRHQFPENATFDQKVRIVFEEIDVNENRLIELDEFRRITRMLNIDLNAATVADLFQRGDLDRDGVLSLSDFQFFCQAYPTMMDSLYFRSKEFWEDNRRRNVIETRRQVLEESRAREQQCGQLSAEARADLKEQEARLQDQERELQDRLLRERDVRSLNLDAKKELEKQQFDKAEREREALHGKEREHRRHAQLQDASNLTESAEKRVQSQEAELSRAQEKEKQLEVLLADARRETERHAKTLSTLGEELHQVREREMQAQVQVLEAQQELRKLQEMVQAAEVELGHKLDRERESDNIFLEAQRETARAAHRRDDEERALQLQRDREHLHGKQHQESARAVDDAEKALQAVEQDYGDYLNRRAQIEQQELPLIEQEIRLREQRFNLEQMESRLKNEAQSFQSVVGRGALASVTPAIGSATRGYSPRR